MPPASAGPNALWDIVNGECVPDQASHGDPAPCAQVDLDGGPSRGYAVLKDLVGATQFLQIPTERLGHREPADRGARRAELLRRRVARPHHRRTARRTRTASRLDEPGDQRRRRPVPGPNCTSTSTACAPMCTRSLPLTPSRSAPRGHPSRSHWPASDTARWRCGTRSLPRSTPSRRLRKPCPTATPWVRRRWWRSAQPAPTDAPASSCSPDAWMTRAPAAAMARDLQDPRTPAAACRLAGQIAVWAGRTPSRTAQSPGCYRSPSPYISTTISLRYTALCGGDERFAGKVGVTGLARDRCRDSSSTACSARDGLAGKLCGPLTEDLRDERIRQRRTVDHREIVRAWCSTPSPARRALTRRCLRVPGADGGGLCGSSRRPRTRCPPSMSASMLAASLPDTINNASSSCRVRICLAGFQSHTGTFDLGVGLVGACVVVRPQIVEHHHGEQRLDGAGGAHADCSGHARPELRPESRSASSHACAGPS